MNRRTATRASAAVAVLAAAVLLFASIPALAASGVPQRLADQLAACEAMAEVAESHAEKAWAEHCVTLAKRAIDAYPEPTPTVAPTPTATTLPPSTPAPTTVAPTTPPPTTQPPATDWPTRDTTGTPAGWVPKRTVSSLTVSIPGAIVEDVRVVGGDIVVTAPGVIIRRVELQGGRINNAPGSKCANNLTVEDSTFGPPAGATWGGSGEGAITYGGYTAKRVAIVDRIEGLRVSGRSTGCGPVVVEDSYVQITVASGCPHADGVQGYDAAGLTMRNTVIDARKMTCGTSAMFYPGGDGNQGPVILDRVWAAGGGWVIVLGPVGSKVTGLEVLAGSGQYGPFDVNCSNVDFSARVVDVAGKTVATKVC